MLSRIFGRTSTSSRQVAPKGALEVESVADDVPDPDAAASALAEMLAATGPASTADTDESVDDAGANVQIEAVRLSGVTKTFGATVAVDAIDLRIPAGTFYGIVGPNGAGKTTTLRTLMCALAPKSGTIRLDGRPIQGWQPEKIARVGMQLVPEERAIFGTLTVEENLRVARLTAPKGWSLDRIWEVFPRLKERRTSRGGPCRGASSRCFRSHAPSSAIPGSSSSTSRSRAWHR